MGGDSLAAAREQIKTLYNTCQRLEIDHKSLESKVDDNHRQILGKVEELRCDLANRLPVWASVVFAMLTAAVGALIGFGVG